MNNHSLQTSNPLQNRLLASRAYSGWIRCQPQFEWLGLAACDKPTVVNVCTGAHCDARRPTRTGRSGGEYRCRWCQRRSRPAGGEHDRDRHAAARTRATQIDPR
jgi:hypothetical protein